ncbi:MAG: PAS domain S-box protein [Burkholderiales bacterium]|nr:PAS domain S-box protein [Burkholderiales bacterium]
MPDNGVPPQSANDLVRVARIPDTTERGASERESPEIVRELHELYHHAPCGYHSLDAQGVVIQINDTELAWLGYARHEVAGRMPFTALLTERSRERFQRNFELLKENGGMREHEYEMLRRDGTSFPVLWRSTVVTGPDGRFDRTRATVFDITKEKGTARQLRRYAGSLRAVSRRLVEVQEAERRALANALHDLVGQKLTALSINLNIVKAQTSYPASSPTGQRLANSLKLVEETIESIRDVMAELRPAVLDDYGLIPALHWYAGVFSKRMGLAADVVRDGTDRRLPPPVEEAFFRIAQEALANVAKYAQATSARITMRSVENDVSLAIADDGCGFDPREAGRPAPDHGWGLALMRERALAVGAALDVDSAPGCGTTVTVRWRGEGR